MAINTETKTTWQIDPAHSIVEFSGRHMMVSTYKGRFKGLKGTIVIDEANPAESSVEVEIDTTTVDSGQEQRDGHLKSPDFLDVATYPTITFKSTKVVPEGNEKAKVNGDLSLHGVTKPVTLDVELNGFGKNPWGKDVAGFEARTTISRKDFDLNFNVALETGGVLLGDTIKIELHIEANK
jgi:polyisoprenoid-binding protein YceI